MNPLITATALASGVLYVSKGLDKNLELTEYVIESDKIPKEFDGYKIIHLSDAHSETVPGLVNAVLKENPDLFVFTGDMTDDDGLSFRPTVHIVEKLIKKAPILMVTGNHDLARPDFPKIEKKLTSMGAKFLRNERIYIERDGAKIAVSGLDDGNATTSEYLMHKLHKNLAQLGTCTGFEILLFHRANLFEHLAGHGFDLVLSGHMHGGQVRIPKVGGVASPKSSILSDRMLFPKYFGGAYKYKNMTMLVNRGLGNPMVIPRLFNRPEIISIILKNKL